MLRVKKETVNFRVIIRSEADKKTVSFPVIDDNDTTKENILEICKNAILNHSKSLNKRKPLKNK